MLIGENTNIDERHYLQEVLSHVIQSAVISWRINIGTMYENRLVPNLMQMIEDYPERYINFNKLMDYFIEGLKKEGM